MAAESGPLAGVTICYVSTEAFSGVTRTMKQARSMRDAGARVIFAGYEALLPEEVRSSGFPVIAAPYRVPPDVRTEAGAFRLAYSRFVRKARIGLRRMRARRRLSTAVAATGANIVQSVDLPALSCAYRAASKLGARLVFDSHEMWTGFLDNPELGLPGWRRWLLLRMERKYAPRADVVFVVSDEMGRRMSACYPLRSVMTVLNSPPGYIRSPRPTGSPVRLVFHGSLARTKNVEDLILAMVQLKDRATLDIHGAAYTVTEEHLRALIRDNGLEGAVRLHGAFSYDRVLSMLERYDVDVYAARMIEENFAISLPNKVFDAICAGLAVAASDFPAIRELIEGCGCGVCIDPASPDSIARSLSVLIDGVAAIDSMKAASVAFAPSCCWEAQAEKITGCFTELLRTRG